MPIKLSTLKCRACEGLEDKLTSTQIKEYLSKISGWKLNKNQIKKSFKFLNFQSSLDFINQVGKLAEQEGHHPDIEFGWGYATITLTTHSLKGLSINDFILAAKIDNL